jgi:hypothetical protein
MAGLAHAGVGLAAKRVAPRAPLGALLLGAYALDVVWGALVLARVERFPRPGVPAVAPWSHGLFMSTIWSAAVAVTAAIISRNPRTGLFAGLLVFSHWVVDFIAKPMTFAFPDDTGLPLLFDGSRRVGLGAWRSRTGVYIGEYGSLLLGLAIYALTVRKAR